MSVEDGGGRNLKQHAVTAAKAVWGKFKSRRAAQDLVQKIVMNPALVASIAAASIVAVPGIVAVNRANDAVAQLERSSAGAASKMAETVEEIKGQLGTLADTTNDLKTAIDTGDDALAETASIEASRIADEIAVSANRLDEQSKNLNNLGSAALKDVRTDLEEVASGLTALGTNVSEIIAQLNEKVATIQASLNTLSSKVGTIEQSLKDTAESLTATQATVQSLGVRLTGVESSILSTLSKLQALAERITTVEANLTTAQNNLKALDDRVAGVADDLATTQGTVQTLGDRATSLEAGLTTASGEIVEIQASLTSIALKQTVLAYMNSTRADAGTTASTNTVTFTVPGTETTFLRYLMRLSFTPNSSACERAEFYVNGFFTRSIAAGAAGTTTFYTEQRAYKPGTYTVQARATAKPGVNPCDMITPTLELTRV